MNCHYTLSFSRYCPDHGDALNMFLLLVGCRVRRIRRLLKAYASNVPGLRRVDKIFNVNYDAMALYSSHACVRQPLFGELKI